MRNISCVTFFVLTLAASAGAQSVREDMLVSTEWLNANRRSVTLLEIGDRATYAGAHIPGAALVELTDLVRDVGMTPNELPPFQQLEDTFARAGAGIRGRIVLYSRDPIYAARAWFTLDYLGGGTRASILDGGIAKWIAEGQPTATGFAVPKRGTFEAALHDDTVARFRAVREAVRNRDTFGSYLVLIDARSPEQFSGDERGDSVARGGHIPGAINVPMSLNFTATATATYRPADELRDLYAGAGVTAKSRNIVYCRTGMQASVTYFVLRYLGFDASLYDGSFVEWSNSDALVE